MPIFRRRALQLMLDELRPRLVASKIKEVVGRLDSVDVDQAIPQEYELGLTWAASKVANIEIERSLGLKAPDFYSSDLFVSAPAFVEIAALSDASLSGEYLMKRAANIINGFADSVVSGSSKHLHFSFHEESGYRPAKGDNIFAGRRYFRRRRITDKFKLDSDLASQIRDWVRGSPASSVLRLSSPDIDVSVTWRQYVHPHGNVFSSMPSMAYDLKNNTLYRVLKDKEREQLKSAPPGVLKCIFLGDAGCSLLRDINPAMSSLESFSGKKIIECFLSQSKIDVVCVFSPGKEIPYGLGRFISPRIWRVSCFEKSNSQKLNYSRIEELVAILPAPYLDGYQARSWHQQGMFNPQARGHYLAPAWTSWMNKMTVKLSARGLQEFLAGRLTHEEFKRFVIDDVFEISLRGGLTISGVSFESTGTNEDDDYIVIEFSDDSAARPLG